MAQVTAWGWFWLSWAIVGIAVELYWVFVYSGNTLSEEIWGIESLDFAHPLTLSAWTPAHWVIAIVLWLFFGWLSVHFPFGWLR